MTTGRSDLNHVHTVPVCSTEFELPVRYRVIKAIGHGAYGVVCSAHDEATKDKVAIKKISQAFYHPTDTKRTLREAKLMRQFDHENIIHLVELLGPSKKNGFDDIYFVSELMDTDLHQIIRSPQELSDDHCQYFLYQILRGMKYIHSADVLHRDLKPSNLLLNSNCDLKICDFGLARAVSTSDRDTDFMTEYVATRWYRAPEILLSWPSYTQAIDVWSTGCIFAELVGRQPLFPGKNYKHQVDLIVEVMGTPNEQLQGHIQSSKARAYLRSLPVRQPKNFREFMPNASPKALDLLQKMLHLDPEKRCTVDEALRHPYLESLHDPEDEPVCGHKVNFEWDKPGLKMHELKEMIYDEVRSYHPELPAWSEYAKTMPPPRQSQKDGVDGITDGVKNLSHPR